MQASRLNAKCTFGISQQGWIYLHSLCIGVIETWKRSLSNLIYFPEVAERLQCYVQNKMVVRRTGRVESNGTATITCDPGSKCYISEAAISTSSGGLTDISINCFYFAKRYYSSWYCFSQLQLMSLLRRACDPATAIRVYVRAWLHWENIYRAKAVAVTKIFATM